MKSLALSLLALALVAGVAPAQKTAAAKLHPALIERLTMAKPGDMIPVYFVLGDRLGFDHWFPRLDLMTVDERREVVISEGTAHAKRTQAELMTFLDGARTAGAVTGTFSNWLGNFVQCQAMPSVIVQAAELASVAEVWWDAPKTLAEVEDGAAVAMECPAIDAEPVEVPSVLVPGADGAPARRLIAGNGPLDTHADQVWALGFTGVGVNILNTDSGCTLTKTDIAGRAWVNPGETAGNGIDDDGDGFIDDVHGWNFGTGTNNVDDLGGHGTNTSGCLVADGTCTGTVYGQAPGAKIGIAALSNETSQWNALQWGIVKGFHTQTSSHSYKNADSPAPNYKMHRDVGETTLAAGLIRTNSTSNNGASCTTAGSLNRKPFNISAPGNVPAPYIDVNQTLLGRKGGVIGVAAHNVGTSTLASYSPCGPFAWNLPDEVAVNPAYPTANWDTVNDNDYPYTGGTQQGCIKPDVSAPTGTTTTSGTTPCGTAVFSGTSNATPVANGVIALWKGANMHLKPEDVGMIVATTSTATGSIAGKENGYGSGKINAIQGLYRALAVHRVDGQPAWNVKHHTTAPVVVEFDGVPNRTVYIAYSFFSAPTTVIPGLVINLANPFTLLYGAATGPTGDVQIAIPTDPSFVGYTVFTQCVLDDTAGVTAQYLVSNLIRTDFIP